MHKEVRRKDRQISESEAMELLINGEYGIMSTISEDGQPCSVPLNYVVIDNYIYFHSARKGEKIDNIKNEERVCFCVVGKTQPVYTDNFTTYYESAVIYGKAIHVVDEEERNKSLLKLCEKYLPEHMDKAADAILKSGMATAVFKISIDRITGKAKR